MKRMIPFAALMALTAGAASSQVTPDSVAAEFAAQGFTRIEIRTGLTQTKVEAVRGIEKLEVVYDTATGAVLKRETETVGAFDDTRDGIEVRNRNRDFLRVSAAGVQDDRSGSDGRHDDDDSDDASEDDGDDRPGADDDDSDPSGHDSADDDRNDDEDDDKDEDDRGDDHGGNDDDDGGDDRSGSSDD